MSDVEVDDLPGLERDNEEDLKFLKKTGSVDDGGEVHGVENSQVVLDEGVPCSAEIGRRTLDTVHVLLNSALGNLETELEKFASDSL